MPTLKLNDGNKIPCLGLGVWQIPSQDTADVVSGAIARGYRLFDGAAAYGNEAGLGEGLRRADVPRSQLFLTTKIWNEHHGHDQTLAAFAESEERLGMAPDLLLIHWPCPQRGLFVDTWRAMIKLRDEGRVRSIGVSNFNAEHLERMIDQTGETPVVNQIELNPGFQQAELRALHDSLGIVTQSWTPLGKSRHFGAAPILAVAERCGKTPAQVILRWHVQLGCSVIPRSANAGRMAENFDIFDFILTQDEMEAIATLETGTRTGPDPLVFG